MTVMKYKFSQHAPEQIRIRGLSISVPEDVMFNPDLIVNEGIEGFSLSEDIFGKQ
jgi:hypothetical protein